MNSVLEDLKALEEKLWAAGFDIDHYEIREPFKGDKDNLRGYTALRAVGPTPLKAASEWEEIDGDDYIVEIFLDGRNPLDRVIYEPGEKLEYLSFEDQESRDLEELLEEV